MLDGRRVVLGVSGGIACYKSVILARRLTDQGAAVDVVLTAAATEFVRPLTFEAVTRRPVTSSLWEPGRALTHIEFGRNPDLIIVAPATAHLIARAAQGLADDLLTAILLAANVPILAAPAMNDRMYAHPATQQNLETLRQRGWFLVGPAEGPLAEGPSDLPGRMVEPEEILAHAERAMRAPGSRLAGRRIVVTAGPTREGLDPVRVITNPSSGRMGYALAERAYARGADVVLVTGPSVLPVPPGVEVVRVVTTEEMALAVTRELPRADALMMAAAPADYRPKEVSADKRRREDGAIEVVLMPTDDILARTQGHRKPGAVVVGFALETGDGRARARAKLERKGLDLIVLNHADDPAGGFEGETNRVWLIAPEEETELPTLSKREVAERILDAIEQRL